MADPNKQTFIGQVMSVRGGAVTVRLDPEIPPLVLISGESYRVGQVGAFVRIPLGYTDLYAVSTQVGATASSVVESSVEGDLEAARDRASGFRWLEAALFGESTAGRFERGISQYPIVGEEVHVVTPAEMDTIYDRELGRDDLAIGRIAGASGIPARLQLSSMVTRHSAIVGSTGSGKSNLVAVALEELAEPEFTSARVLVVDPHGEYSAVVPTKTRVVKSGAAGGSGTVGLHVPYWALPLEQLLALTMGELQPQTLELIRDRVRDLRIEAATLLTDPPPESSITADSPIPFSLRRLWYELEDQERMTFSQSQQQDSTTQLPPDNAGSETGLIPPQYPAATSYNTAPYPNRQKKNISRQLDLLRSRLRDEQFAFMFDPAHPTSPNHDGQIVADLDSILVDWVGGTEPITVVDVSGVPAEALSIVVGTMVRIIYDALFWAMNIPVGGRHQPLLIIVDEAHLFLPQGLDSPAHRTFSRIAKEGRKYGVGLMVVTQRPSDVDSAILSQCGTMIALRVSNSQDRSAVSSAIPDDLGGLTAMLPALRTGEALVLGEALQIPSRVRVRLARNKPIGDDPLLPAAWLTGRPADSEYATALKNWRLRRT